MDITQLQAKLAKLEHVLPSQREWMERLLFQLAFNKVSHIEAIGSDGAGKSTLALFLAELFSDDFNVALVKSKRSSTNLANQVMQQWFGISANFDEPLSEQVDARIDETPLLLIVDDADKLDDDELSQLLSTPALVIAFANDAFIAQSLALTINPPTTADAKKLLATSNLNDIEIAKRLADADGNLHTLITPTFSADSVEPSLISTEPLTIAEPVVTPVSTNAPILQPDHEKPAKTSLKPAYMVIAVALLALLVYFFWPKSETVKKSPARVAVQIPVADEKPLLAKLENEPLTTAISKEAIEITEITPTQNPADADSAQQTPTLSEIEKAESDFATTISNEVVSAPETSSNIESKVASEIKPETEPLAEKEPVVAENATNSFSYDEAELLSLNEKHIALQLALVSSEEAVKRFKKANPDISPKVYQRIWQGNKQWIVVLAPFESAQAARLHIKELPKAVISAGPFVKKIQDVQTEIHAQQRTLQVIGN